VFEVDLPVNIARKAKTVRRVLGDPPLSVRLVALEFERDDLLTALAEHGYHTDYRAFFICEGVTQYLTEDGVRRTLQGLRAAAPGSRFVFTYVRRDFIDGTNLYRTPTLYRNTRERQQLWQFGLPGSSANTAGGWWNKRGLMNLSSATSSQPAANSTHRSWNGRFTRRKSSR
jgi:methyltransferase (TIGR00027 family)